MLMKTHGQAVNQCKHHRASLILFKEGMVVTGPTTGAGSRPGRKEGRTPKMEDGREERNSGGATVLLNMACRWAGAGVYGLCAAASPFSSIDGRAGAQHISIFEGGGENKRRHDGGICWALGLGVFSTQSSSWAPCGAGTTWGWELR